MDPRDIHPTHLEGFEGESLMTANELDKLVEITPLRGHVIECGTACGVTAGWLAQRRPECRIVSIDPYIEHVHRLPQWHANRRSETQTLWVGTLKNFAIYTPGWKFDAVYIDADHFHQGIYGDLLYAEKLVKPDGIITSHDYELADWPDVTKAVNRFCAESSWKIVDRTGCLVIMRKQ